MGCESSAETMQGKKIVFSYFDLYGRGEPGRMMLSHAKVDFVDDRIANEAWPSLKGSKFGGNGLPIITLTNGKMISQSQAVYRLLGRQYGYYPTNVEIQLEHDWIADNYVDLFAKIAPAIFFEKDPVAKQKLCDDLFGNIMPNFFNAHKRYFTSPGKFLFGDTLTVADFLMGKLYTDYFNNPNCPHGEDWKKVLAGAPEFEAYGKRFSMEMAPYLAKRPKCPL